MRVTGEDWSRLGDDAEALTEWNANEAFMRMEGGRCVALVLESGRALCRVYERRPEVCRALERGSPACAAERDKGLVTLRASIGDRDS